MPAARRLLAALACAAFSTAPAAAQGSQTLEWVLVQDIVDVWGVRVAVSPNEQWYVQTSRTGTTTAGRVSMTGGGYGVVAGMGFAVPAGRTPLIPNPETPEEVRPPEAINPIAPINPVVVTPEPSTWALLLTALAGLLVFTRGKRRGA